MTFRSTIFLLILVGLLTPACKEVKTTASKIETKTTTKFDQLVWADEFNEDGLPNDQHWSYDVGDACDLPAGCGWGNKELQYYTKGKKENARIENGMLVIEVHREKMHNSEYTSARLVGKGKSDVLYGRIEVKAKLPSGVGTWPAIWMLPKENKYGGWPKSGEIDIMEHVGHDKNMIYGTPHTEAFNGMIGTYKAGEIEIADAEENFHVYAIEWTPDQIEWSVDDQSYHTFKRKGKGTAEWPFDQPFHLILNIAVGGNWGGQQGVDTTIWPQKMLIDYVRIYEKK